MHQLSLPGEDSLAALEELASGLDAPQSVPGSPLQRPALPDGALDPTSVAQALAALLPEDAVIINEAATSGFAIPALTQTAPPHDWLDLTGGSIGMGIPASTGAAIACPGQRVVNLQADGSGMYTVQALWTQARENLDITTVIFANRKYAILQVEFMRVGAHNPGPKAMDMLELTRPRPRLGVTGQRDGGSGDSCDGCRKFFTCARAQLRDTGSVSHRGRALMHQALDPSMSRAFVTAFARGLNYNPSA